MKKTDDNEGNKAEEKEEEINNKVNEGNKAEEKEEEINNKVNEETNEESEEINNKVNEETNEESEKINENTFEDKEKVVDSQNLKKYDELFDKFQRLIAEYDNFRKRTNKEKTNMYDDGVRNTAEKILPIIDNFQRAMDSFEKTEDNFYKGIEMILRQFLTSLNEIGVEKISAVGETFDHNLHFAVAHVEDDSYGENEVIEELQKGYMFKDKVIRHSMVKVAN